MNSETQPAKPTNRKPHPRDRWNLRDGWKLLGNASDYLHADLDHVGEGYEEHARAHAHILRTLTKTHREPGNFRFVVTFVAVSCYVLRESALLIDKVEGEHDARRAALADLPVIDGAALRITGDALRVTPDIRERFLQFMREEHPQGSPGIVIGEFVGEYGAADVDAVAPPQKPA